MKTNGRKETGNQIQIEPTRSKYAGKPLHSEKEEAAKRVEGKVMEILKRNGMIKQ